MVIALLLAAAPLFSNPRVAVWDSPPDPGPRASDAVVVEVESASARAVPKGAPLALKGRSIVVELLTPPEGPLPDQPGLPDAFSSRPGIEKLLETERVTVWRYQWKPGQRTQLHFHPRDAVVTFLADGVLASITPDGKRVLNKHQRGLARWGAKARIHQEELVEGEARAIMVELK